MGLYDAVPVPMMGPEETVRFLRDRFPKLGHLFSDPENMDPSEPYYSCGRLADEVLRRQDDQALLESFYSLINEMATSRQYWLEETLGDILEALVHDEAFAAKRLANGGPPCWRCTPFFRKQSTTWTSRLANKRCSILRRDA
jgi:predicted ATPase